MGRRKTVCVYIDSELVEEAAKAAEAQGASLSGLVEEALRLYVLYVLRRPVPQAKARRAGRRKPPAESPHREAVSAIGEPPLQGNASATPQSAPIPPQLPPHLQNNAWIAVLRSRR